MTGLYRCFDAANPPDSTPPGCAAALGYVGAPGRAYHIWTTAEWHAHPGTQQFPAWVPNLANHPVNEAGDILTAMHQAGWTPGHLFAAVIDYETTGFAAAGWHSALTQSLGRFNVDGIAYGSESTVVQTEAAHLWVAKWDGVQELDPAGQTVHGHQYAANVPYGGTVVDYSVVDTWLMSRGMRR